MEKRGQTQQVFIFIFAAVVIALLFLFGSNLVVKVVNFGKDVETEKFIQDLKQQIELVNSYNIGSSVSFKDIQIPKQVKEICFENRKLIIETEETREEEILFLRSTLVCVKNL